MSKLMNIGFGNVINTSKIITIISADSAPAKRLVQKAKEEGRSVDATQGRRTRGVILTESNHIVLSALQPDTLASRFTAKNLGLDMKGTEND